MGRRRTFRSLSEVTEDLIGRREPQTTLARIQSAWPKAAGETLAGWASPVSERGGVVTFACSDSMVASELEMLKSELLQKLAAELPSGAPSELRFTVR